MQDPLYRNSHILIVEDNRTNIKLLEHILRPHGYEISVAMTASQAMENMYTKKFDLVLLDVVLPDQDGYQIARQIKLSEPIKDIPIIFLTGKTDIADIVAGFEAGGVDYVTKPFNSKELLARIDTHVALRHARQEIQTLRGILQVCANCKRVRENATTWITLEDYVRRHTEAELSHGLCTDCMNKLYPEVAARLITKQQALQ